MPNEKGAAGLTPAAPEATRRTEMKQAFAADNETAAALKARIAELEAAVAALSEPTAPPLTAEGHLAALIDLLIDEPVSAVQAILDGFVRRFEVAHEARRAQGVPCRSMTADEAKADERHQALQEVAKDIAGAINALNEQPKKRGRLPGSKSPRHERRSDQL